MSPILKRLSLLWLVFLPSSLFAQTSSDAGLATLNEAVQQDTTAIFNLPVTDPSLNFLGQLFGTVGPVLHGTSGQLLGSLFQYFNLGILVVSGIFLLWTTVKVVIHSSHEGSFMGKEVSAGYHIIRTILGIGLLAPSAAGYSMIQIIVMWAVLQGAGFANTTWNAALDYFEQGGQTLVAPSINTSQFVNLVGSVLEAQVCMYYHEKLESGLQIDAKNQIKNGNTAPIYATRAQNFPSYQPYIDNTNKWINFPSSRGNSTTDNGCGQFSWANPTASYEPYLFSALTQVMADTLSAARRVVSPMSQDNNPVSSPTGGKTTQLGLYVQTALVGAAADWVNLTLPIRAQKTGASATTAFFDQARADGWLYAGAYYYELSSIQRTVSAPVGFQINKPPACFAPAIYDPNIGGAALTLNPITTDDNCIGKINTSFASSVNPNPDFKSVYAKAASFGTGAAAIAQRVAAANSKVTMPAQINTGNLGMAGMFLSGFIGGTVNSYNSLAGPADPIMKLQTMGNGLISNAIGTWIGISIAMFFVSLLASLMSSISSAGFAIRDMLFIIVPMLLALMGVELAIGVVCSVYVPLIPFIIYTFSAIGWLIAVIEAMVAAPLVALGVTHPEGQGLMGKGEQAIMLLLGVFLRPVCMVIGLIAGMLLSYIGLTILNYPFVSVISDNISLNGVSAMGQIIGILTIYMTLVIQIVTQAYSLIFNVPDRVLRWLGQQVEVSGAGQAMQAAEGAGKGAGEAQAKGLAAPQQPSGGGGGGGGGGGKSAGGK